MDVDITDDKPGNTEFRSQGDLIQSRCLVCGQEDTNYSNIFNTKTCRDLKLAVCLATALQKDIAINAIGSEVICKSCQNLVEKAELLAMQLETTYNQLRSLHLQTIEMFHSDGVEISQLSLDKSSQIIPASPEPRKKPRKDQHFPRKELPPVIISTQIELKRKRGRPSNTINKKLKDDNLESTNKSLERPPGLIVIPQVSSEMPNNIKEAALFETSINDKHSPQNTTKLIDKKYKNLNKNKESTKTEILRMKLKQNELNLWLRQRCHGKVDQQDQEKIKGHDTLQENVLEKSSLNVKQKKCIQVDEFEHKKQECNQNQEQHILKSSPPNIKQSQKNKQNSISAKQNQTIKKQETFPTTEENHTEMKEQRYKVHKVPKSTDAALVLKFKKIRSESVNYSEAFDSDSDSKEDHSEHRDPDFKLSVNKFGLRFKRTKYLRKRLAGKEAKKITKKKKRKILKKKRQLRMDTTKEVLGKENTYHDVKTATENKAEKDKMDNSEPESDQDRRKKESKKRTCQPDLLSVKRLKVCLKDIYKSSDTEAMPVSDNLADNLEGANNNHQTCSINSEKIEEINPYWVSSNYSLHEELIIKEEIEEDNNDLGETYSPSDNCDITNSNHNFSKINIKTEIVESENEFDNNITANNEYNFSSVPVKCESIQVKNELLDSMCAKMESMFPCSNRNSNINYCSGDENKNSAYQIWSMRPIKLSPQRPDSDKESEAEYFCDICGEDFNSVERLKNHIEVDHFSPNY